MHDELDKLEKAVSRIKNAKTKGLISHRLAAYSACLAQIDFLDREASYYAMFGNTNGASQSLAEARTAIDTIYNTYNPSVPFVQQSLVNFAKERYEQAVKKVERVLSEYEGRYSLQ